MKQKHLKYIRIAIAAVMFVLFVAVGIGVRQLNAVLVTQFGPGLMGLASALFVDTVAAVILIVVATLLFGRIYCSILCPLGILQDGIAWLTHWKKWKWNRYRFLDTRPVKYGVFLFVLILGAAGVMLPFVALLPSSNFFTIVSNVFLRIFSIDPGTVREFGSAEHAAQETGALFGQFSVDPPAAAFAFSLGIFLIVAALAAWRGRIYCNTLCPVGAVLSLLGRNPLYRITLSQEMCVCCGMCEVSCKGGAINSKKKSVLAENCVMCFNCIGACKRGGVTLEKRPKMASFDLSRRHFIGTASGIVAGAGAAVLAHKLEKTLPRPSSEPAMPPGAGNAKRFHSKCVGCGICIRECEGKVLVPAVGQYGLAGFMQPVVDYSRGSCLYDCNHCSYICPANALLPLSLEDKQLTRIGIAHVNMASCIGCALCFSKCPVKAIGMSAEDDGWKASVSADHCIGCGACQNVCPLPDGPAITVSGVSEQIRVKKADVQSKPEMEEEKPENQETAPAKKVAVVNTNECFSCGLCAAECPFSAIAMIDGLPSVNADACVGCGLCASNCPAGAIGIRGGEGPVFELGDEEVVEQG